jgi:hypothetical protein
MARFRTLAFLLAIALLPLAGAALAADQAAAPAGADVARPSAPAEDPGTDLVPLDLQPPEPVLMCKAGWCSSDEQCEDWFGPGSTCYRPGGASCGQCIF